MWAKTVMCLRTCTLVCCIKQWRYTLWHMHTLSCYNGGTPCGTCTHFHVIIITCVLDNLSVWLYDIHVNILLLLPNSYQSVFTEILCLLFEGVLRDVWSHLGFVADMNSSGWIITPWFCQHHHSGLKWGRMFRIKQSSCQLFQYCHE